MPISEDSRVALNAQSLRWWTWADPGSETIELKEKRDSQWYRAIDGSPIGTEWAGRASELSSSLVGTWPTIQTVNECQLAGSPG